MGLQVKKLGKKLMWHVTIAKRPLQDY
jgi:hypothetical protein